MSFKRVGDDFDSIKVQKKFRVSELLLEDIPEDEATLMRNGRFACLVCKHNPVFDTVAVLSIHRQGKKHLANAKIRLEKLREDEELRQKRTQENYLRNCKPDLNTGEEKAPLLTLTQKRKELALNDSPRSVTTSQGSTGQPMKQKNVPFFQSRAVLESNLPDRTQTKRDLNVAPEVSNGRVEFSDSQGKAASMSSKCVKQTCSGIRSCGTKGKITAKTVVHTSVDISAEERAKRQHIARLTRNGWIRDWDGKWMKDDDVEFDSDEDEAPLF